MAEELITERNVAELIDYLMKIKDPATVGLRRILKRKEEISKDFPLQTHALEELTPNKDMHGRIFTETESRVIELEKNILELNKKLEEQKRDGEQAVRDAYQKGVLEGSRKGEKTGEEKAKAEYENQIKNVEERLCDIFGTIEKSRKNLFYEAHRIILDMSILIARKIIKTELSLNKNIVLSVIKKALSYIVDKQEFLIRVAPDDMETVSNKKDFWSTISERFDKISIEKDERIERGGCIIESNTGVTDARIGVQIEGLIDIIESEWNNIISSNYNEEIDNPEDIESPEVTA